MKNPAVFRYSGNQQYTAGFRESRIFGVISRRNTAEMKEMENLAVSRYSGETKYTARFWSSSRKNEPVLGSIGSVSIKMKANDEQTGERSLKQVSV